MSKIITSKSSMTDRELALEVIKAAGYDCHESGRSIYFTSGPLSNARLDLKTGNITGDSDWGHTEATLGVLRQRYSEAQIRREYQKNGTTIEARDVEKNGDVILMWQMA